MSWIFLLFLLADGKFSFLTKLFLYFFNSKFMLFIHFHSCALAPFFPDQVVIIPHPCILIKKLSHLPFSTMKCQIIRRRRFAEIGCKIFLPTLDSRRSSTKGDEMLLAIILIFVWIGAFIKSIIIAVICNETVFNFEVIRRFWADSKSLLRKAFSASDFDFRILIIDKLHKIGVPCIIGGWGAYIVDREGSGVWLFTHIKIKLWNREMIKIIKWLNFIIDESIFTSLIFLSAIPSIPSAYCKPELCLCTCISIWLLNLSKQSISPVWCLLPLWFRLFAIFRTIPFSFYFLYCFSNFIHFIWMLSPNYRPLPSYRPQTPLWLNKMGRFLQTWQ